MRTLRTLAAVAAVLGGLVLAGPARATDGACQPDVEGMAATPVGGVTCDGTGARPGALVRTPLGGCTLNFVFEGSDGNRYIGTAGHCILLKYGGVGRTWPAGEGPWAKIDGRAAGEFAYATFDFGSRDFALIRLDPAFPWSPAVQHFGGPTGLYTDHVDERVVVHHTGNGLVVGNAFNSSSYGVGPQDVRPLAARTGLASHTMYVSGFFMHGAVLWGDSGGGVIAADGRAMGTLVLLTPDTPDEGNNYASRLDDSIALAEQTLGITLALQTAPLRTG